jgi:hypothetical protein
LAGRDEESEALLVKLQTLDHAKRVLLRLRQGSLTGRETVIPLVRSVSKRKRKQLG